MGVALAIALLAGAAGARADAPEIVKATKAGQEVKVRQHAPAFSGGCSGAMPTLTFDPKPAHGTVDVRPDRFIMGKGYTSGNASSCDGQPVDGIAIWYIPAAGFHGVDQFAWTADFGGKGKRRRVDTHSAQITVQ
jgi:hypothetical protein